MKNFIIFTVIISFILLVNKPSFSEEINVNQTFSTDTTFNPFPGPEVMYSLKITGNVEMHSLSSLIRVIVSTDKGEFMIFEIYPLISIDSVLDFRDMCDETCYLDGVTPYSVRIEIIEATINLDYLSYDKDFVENATSLQYQAKKAMDHEKVDLMNKKIAELEMDWIAGNTSLVELFYQDKKGIYQEDYNLLGYDYYSGGIYQVIGQVYEPVTDFLLVHDWDWRNRHSANVPGTPYFDEDVEYFTGWLTIPKHQNVPHYCGACGIFGSTGALEAVINLYYNQHLDLDLSEQHLLACVPNATCGNVDPHLVREYLKDYGVVTEACSPYLGVDEEDDCEDPDIVCTNPDTKVRITSYTEFIPSPASDWEDIFAEMVLSGPISLTINNGAHYVTLIGWHYDDLQEKLYIIFKDSYGTNHGTNGFVIQQVNGNYYNAASLHDPFFVTIPDPPSVQVNDADSDGFYWWGIGPPPEGYENMPRDCDDSNPAKGPYLADYSCDCDDTYGNDTLRITSNNTVWPGIVKIEDPVSIENGGQLTITGTVYVPPPGQIVVKQGGRLIINGGKITKSCDQLWKGIQVWGRISLSQYPTSNQGYLNIINGGVIEYAKTAVYVGRIVSDNPYYVYSGGIVIVQDASFLNNEVDVEFLPFINNHPYSGQPMDNFGGFMNCTFKMYDPEFVLPKPIAHVILDGVNGIEFYSCLFKTQEVQNYPIDIADRGIGILANDANIFVRGTCTNAIIPCNNYDSSKFVNLRYGIKAFNPGGNRYFSVCNSVFDSNVAGIYLSGYHQPEILSSFFTNYLGLSQIPGPENPFYGCLYIDGSTGYHIENNFFKGPYSGIYGPYHIVKLGIYIRNSGEENNEIYSNLFTGLDAGIVAEGINKGNGTGLCLKCNDFSHCLNDMMVIPSPFRTGGRYVGIKENQGANSTTSSALAGNTFTTEIQDLQAFEDENVGNYKCYWSYYNVADHINYYHHELPLSGNPVTYPTEDNYSEEKITLTNKNVDYIKEEACPSGLNNNRYKSGEDPWLEIAESDAHLSTYQNSYDSLLDGGNTEELDYEILSGIPDEALELRQQLLTNSPYLSDTVMKQAIYKENVLPNAMIRDVLSANPQSAKSGEILEAVDSRYDPMPDYMMAEIMQGKEQIGALESLESNMGYWEQYRTRAINRLIRKYLTDSTITMGVDSLINLLQNESDVQSKYRLAFTYWENQQEEQAMSTLSAIPTDFELSSSEQAIHQEYLDFFDILQMMNDSSFNARQLDSSSVQELTLIMDSDLPQISAYARGLLVKGRFIDFSETVSFPSELKSYPDYYYLDPKDIDFPEEDHLLLFPNPSGDYVIAYFNSIEYSQQGTIIIDDLLGKRIAVLRLSSEQNQLVIKLSDYPNGLYFISLIINNKLIESEKLSKGSH
jgi:hypothetical protein